MYERDRERYRTCVVSLGWKSHCKYLHSSVHILINLITAVQLCYTGQLMKTIVFLCLLRVGHEPIVYPWLLTAGHENYCFPMFTQGRSLKLLFTHGYSQQVMKTIDMT